MLARERLYAIAATTLLIGSTAFAPALAQEIPANCTKPDIRKPCIVPESVVRALTAEQRAQAIQYARENDIRWRIARGR